MKFYLSSYRIGDHGEKLVSLSGGGPLAYIANALDHIPREKLADTRKRNENDLKSLDISFEELDLKDFFDEPQRLRSELTRFSGVWITGGNCFVLRQAMKLSGFDIAISDLVTTDFLYGGYSAGICSLAPSLKGLQIVDDPNLFPYPQINETIWEGLGLINHLILPHYKSDHPESADIDKEVEYCKAHDIPHKTLQDGDVLYGEDINRLAKEIAINP